MSDVLIPPSDAQLPPALILPSISEPPSSIDDPSALLPFVQYDPADGRILVRGQMQKTVVESLLDQNYAIGVGDPELNYVNLDDKTVREREFVQFSVDHPSVPAGEAVTITGLPAGTAVFLNGNNVGASEGECEFTPNEPGTYRFEFVPPHPRWRKTLLTITATDTSP